MAINLLDLAKSYLSNGVLSQFSGMLGENEQNTQRAIEGALPAILGGLIQKVNEPGGAGSVMDMIGEIMSPNPATGNLITPENGILGQLGDILANKTQSSSLLSMGASILKSLFGDKTNALTSSLASYSGVKQTSASSLLNLAGPVLVSVLGKKLADDGTGISGLSSLLSGQASNLTSAMPSGLGALLGAIPGLSILGGLGSKAGEFISSVNQPTARVAPTSNVPPARPTPPPAYQNQDDRSSGAKWLPWLLLLLGLGALFYFMRSCGTEKETVSTTTETIIDSTSATLGEAATGMGAAADSVNAAVDSAGSALEDAAAKLGAFFKRKLPSGLELNIPELGIENNLIKFIEDKSKPVDKTTWFNFDRLLFDTGKATLRPESQEQLTNIAAILKEYPAVNIKLGGYTDNTGSAAINKKLSQDRADMVLGELVKLGIDKSRLEAEGYGPEHPVASNDTEAGRAENRRIAIRVTKK
ncbi:hypothetical protein GCM10028807_49430 [Spirosoma daeguense]